ncbi:TerB family tellurite resistance protein [bacterium CPR1]|nr:TerB family tellurite resistance protein [bacterium CPR1]
MEEREIEIVKSLIQISWADGRWSPDEEALVGLILARLGLSASEIEGLKARFQSQTDMAQLERYVPDKPSRMNAMRLLLAVAYSDLDIPDEEALYLGTMATRLGITPAELDELMEETIRRRHGRD